MRRGIRSNFLRAGEKLHGQARLQRLAFWCVILVIAIGALVAGLVLRRYAWDQTEPIRFTADIDNAFQQGTNTMRAGFLDRYDESLNSHEDEENMSLDYAPGRLLIATIWTRWVREQMDGPKQDFAHPIDWTRGFYERAWAKHRQYELCRPMLCINTTGEILSAIAMFMLVRRWTRGSAKRKAQSAERIQGVSASSLCTLRSALCASYRSARPEILGLIAALFFWFNPALIWNAHCWPQWDSWVLPFFLWAMVAASTDFWFCAGLLIAAGAMFKAQILFVSPMFLLWPLFRGQGLAVVRLVIGLATGGAACTAVWLLRNGDHFNDDAVRWVAGMIAAAVLLPLVIRSKWIWYIKTPVALLAVGLVLWPFFKEDWGWLLGAVIAFGDDVGGDAIFAAASACDRGRCMGRGSAMALRAAVCRQHVMV